MAWPFSKGQDGVLTVAPGVIVFWALPMGLSAPDEFESDEIRTRPTLLGKLSSGGNEDAWVRFYEMYQGVILGMARRWGLPEASAWDVLQEVMLAVNRISHSFSYDSERRVFLAGTANADASEPGKRGGFRQWLFTVVKRTIWKHRYGARRERELSFSDLAGCQDEKGLREYYERTPTPDPSPDAITEEKAESDYRLSLLENAIRLLPECTKRSHPRKTAIFLALKQPHVFDSIADMESDSLPPGHMAEIRALHQLKANHRGELTKQMIMTHYSISSNHVDQEVKAIKLKLAAIFTDLRSGRDPREK
jgi:DNA-directed RNA polymerase specialized sigma24 family protein